MGPKASPIKIEVFILTLSEFLNVLNDHLGYVIQPDSETKRVTEPLIVKDFLSAFVDDSVPESLDVPDYKFLSQSDDYLRRVFKGTKELPYNDANSLLNRMNYGMFYDFMPTEPTSETLNNMKLAFKTYGEKIDVSDYAYSLGLILRKILMDIVLSNQECRIRDPRFNDLLIEVDMECPLNFNHKKPAKLLETIKDTATNKMKPKANFYVVKIFPDSLTPDLLAEFTKIQKKPSNTNDDLNKICLCEKCAKSYMVKPTVATFKKLLSIKNNMISSKKIKSATSGINLEDDINSVLKALCNMTLTDEILKLRMIPIEVKEKIYDENIDLKKKINNDLPDYIYIKKLFSSLDEKGSIFNIIANEIKLCYSKLSAVETDQSTIYYAIVDWILEQSCHDKNRYRLAGEKIVSFFVIDCEVFDEISK